ncbi:MAG: hypothetical protein EAZ89_16030 [Bacteroidetes bacterium]|nr:MAG: hypothetical protein EAZ89_16030 [Bacteroidota bacterium]
MRLLFLLLLLSLCLHVPAQKPVRQARPQVLYEPPDKPLRTMAEWEEVEHLVVVWSQYPAVLSEVVRYAREVCHVWVVCLDSMDVKRYLREKNIPLAHISYLETDFNSIWIRDYGPQSVYINGVDSLILTEWSYNRPRPLDDHFPVVLAKALHLPLVSLSRSPNELVHTGGNFMTDGMGTALSSRLILHENNRSAAAIDTLMRRSMGIERYIKLEELPFDGIHHIDMHMKLLDEETLLVGAYPPGKADGPQIEDNLAWLTGHTLSGFGRPWKTVRIPMPPDGHSYPDTEGSPYRTYTNLIFINTTVLVPLYDAAYDSTALRIIRAELPGYKVQGIDCRSVIRSGGALHCMTLTLGVRDPLLIVHQPLPDTLGSRHGYEVSALIRHRSGIREARLWYRTDNQMPFIAVPMHISTLARHTWTASIPPQKAGRQVQYYIEAESVSGKVMRKPLPGADGPWRFRILKKSGSPEAPFTR